MFDFTQPIVLADLLTPAMILVVGLSQVGVVLAGVFLMRNAARERSRQMEPLLEGLRESTAALREITEISRESRETVRATAKDTRELLLRNP